MIKPKETLCDICQAPARGNSTLCTLHQINHYGGHAPYKTTVKSSGLGGSAAFLKKGGTK